MWYDKNPDDGTVEERISEFEESVLCCSHPINESILIIGTVLLNVASGFGFSSCSHVHAFWC